MATCPGSNNPNLVVCPIPQRRFAQIGHQNNGHFSHAVTGSIVLETPSGTTQLFSRDRTAGMTWVDYIKALDAISCGMAQGGGSTFSASSYDTDYTCSFQETQTLVNNEILYLDLRHNIITRKETTYTFDKVTSSPDSVEWNPSNFTIWLHKITPGDIAMTVTEKIFVGAELIDTNTYPMIAEIEFAFAVPPYSGQPQQAEPENYYLWFEHRDEDGGLDLYYPTWLQGLSATTLPIDAKNKGRHLRITRDREIQASYTIGVADILATFPTKRAGSWAVSPSKDAAGNNLRAYCTKKLNGTDFALKLSPFSTETAALFGSPTEAPLPIAPL